MQSRTRERKEISCYPPAEAKFRIVTLHVVSLSRYVIRNQNNLDPGGSWRYVKCGGKSRESREAAEAGKQEHESMRALAVQECCAVLTSCQRISAQWFSAWLRGPRAHRALLAVKPELCARLDRVTIVKRAAKVQWLHSARFTFALSLSFQHALTGQNRNTQCAIWCISPNQLTVPQL